MVVLAGTLVTATKNKIYIDMVLTTKEGFRAVMIKTDLQKYKDFFNEMKIGYTISKRHAEIICIDIKEEHIYYSYGNSISIIFNNKEEFIEFEAWGE